MENSYAEFEIEGKTLVYDYNELRLAQMKMAEAIYGYQADLEKRPPRSLREKVELGGADYDQQVLSHILLLRLPDGSLQRYKGGETQRPILDLVNQMPAAQVKQAEEVIGDFFARRGRYTLALLVRSKYEMLYSEIVVRGLAAAAQQMQTSEPSSQNDAAESKGSTTPASASEELEPA